MNNKLISITRSLSSAYDSPAETQQLIYLTLPDSDIQNAIKNNNKVQKSDKHPTNKLDEPFRIKYRSFLQISAIVIFTTIAITAGVITVYLTSPKRTNRTCQFNFERSAKQLKEYDSRPNDIDVGDFNDDGYLDIVVANYGTDYVEILLQTC